MNNYVPCSRSWFNHCQLLQTLMNTQHSTGQERSNWISTEANRCVSTKTQPLKKYSHAWALCPVSTTRGAKCISAKRTSRLKNERDGRQRWKSSAHNRTIWDRYDELTRGGSVCAAATRRRYRRVWIPAFELFAHQSLHLFPAKFVVAAAVPFVLSRVLLFNKTTRWDLGKTQFSICSFR